MEEDWADAADDREESDAVLSESQILYYFTGAYRAIATLKQQNGDPPTSNIVTILKAPSPACSPHSNHDPDQNKDLPAPPPSLGTQTVPLCQHSRFNLRHSPA